MKTDSETNIEEHEIFFRKKLHLKPHFWNGTCKGIQLSRNTKPILIKRKTTPPPQKKSQNKTDKIKNKKTKNIRNDKV